MKKALLILSLCLISEASAHHLTPCLIPNQCHCVTPRCAGGFSSPAPSKEISYADACEVGGAALCGIASLKIKKKQQRKRFFSVCTGGNTALCLGLCK